MDTDLALILGLLVSCLSLPSMVSAISEGHAPRVATILTLSGGGLILYALASKPGGYAFDQLPDVFFSVISRFMS